MHDAPAMVAAGDGGGWVFWSALCDGSWQLLGRRLEEGRWAPPVVLSDGQGDALMPAAALPDGRLLSVWSGSKDRHFRIWSRLLEGDSWQDPVPVSSDRHESFRPAVAAEPEGAAWVVWDSYRNGN